MSDPSPRLTAALADRYRLERELGAGGMATVYLAQDLKHDRKVAIKVLRPELAAVIGAERFLREIKTIATLQHPHILGLIDSGEVNGTAYYVMPFVEGESLRDRLNREKQLPVADAVRIATEVAGALDYAHRHGVIHRDIKPENILLHDGSALVADFGIALAASKSGSTRMTETGMSLGTPHYMSPEQAMGERDITARSDVYALGCVTYEMLVGDPPFTGSTAQAIVAKVMTEKPVPLQRQRERVPDAVEDAVLTALEKLPADRFASAAVFAEALTGSARTATRTSTGRGPSWLSDWRSRLALGVAVIALAAAPVLQLRGRGGVDLARVSMAQKTFAQQTIFAARWSPDGETVVYSATNTRELGMGPGLGQRAVHPRLYVIRADYPEPQPFGPDSAHLLAVSSKNEVALLTHPRYLAQRLFVGTLARMPLGGGAPREVLEQVQEADWSPDGSQLAVTRPVGGGVQLEYPVGKVLYHSGDRGYLSDPRVSPAGDRVAFFDHQFQYDDRGTVMVVDTSGNSTTIDTVFGGLEGLAWLPDGKSLLFTAARNSPYQIRRAAVGGPARIALPSPGILTLHDVTADGRWLVTRDDRPTRVIVHPPGFAGSRDLSWLDGSRVSQISADGELITLSDDGTLSGVLYSTLVRQTNGAPAVRVGHGSPRGISADKRWILSWVPTTPPEYWLYPTGPGESHQLSWKELESVSSVTFFPDGRSLLVCGSETGKAPRCYRSPLDATAIDPVTPDSIATGLLRPDGRVLAVSRTDGWWIYPLGKGAPQLVPGSRGAIVVRWSPDGKALWVRGLTGGKPSIDRVDVATGRRTLLKTIEMPPDMPVFILGNIALADDPEVYAYNATSYISMLFVVEGVR
ncbi:MAG: protein kinase [Gemmatimonadales bacterium]